MKKIALIILIFSSIALLGYIGVTNYITPSNNSLKSYQILPNEKIMISYGFYNIMYNCNKKGFDYFSYSTVPDTGNLKRYKPFHQDKQIPKKCRQTSTNTYKTPKHIEDYDRGHGNHSNLWDHSKDFMKATNYMTNIVPHAREMNRSGLWRHIEKLTECHRDLSNIDVIGGNIWGDNKENDHFLSSHGVYTPDELFKILIVNETDVYAWVMPNHDSSTKDKVDELLVTINDIENALGYPLPIKPELKSQKAKDSLKLPKNCSIK